MKKLFKNKNGITLISLVVTIIVLLILAGISIGMLSGDNGILGQAGNAKTQTDIAQEKEIINLAVVDAMNKSKYGDIDETSFTNELEKNNVTVTKSGNKYKVTFPSTRQYEVDSDGNVKEKKVNPNALEISELNENASTYLRWDVINYAETLPTDLQNTQWQLFYAGALDGETEERIYLISKDLIDNEIVPEKNGAKPIALGTKTSIFSSFQTNVNKINDGILPQYFVGSDLITETNLRNLNSKYFKFLSDNNTYSKNPNIMGVAYMLDKSVWSSFSTSSKNYADYAIGGPTIELLITALNLYSNRIYEVNKVNKAGYEITSTAKTEFDQSKIVTLSENSATESPYSVYNQCGTSFTGYWLASPAYNNSNNLPYRTRFFDEYW